MELLFLLGLAALFAILIYLRKMSARRRFLRAVKLYDHQRSLQIEAGDDPSFIPTVEEFLAVRGEIHLLTEVDWVTSESPAAAEAKHADVSESYDRDDGYGKFVDKMWDQKGIDLKDIVVERETASGLIACTLYTFVDGPNGYGYLNLYEDGERKTYAADARHKWHRFGRIVDSSAFLAIQRGADPDLVLRFQEYARSFDEAVLPNFDKIQTTEKRYAIAYRSDDRGISYRVVSKVIRLGDHFSARCHFRWGERRTFLSKNLKAVLDLQTGLPINAKAFLAKRK